MSRNVKSEIEIGIRHDNIGRCWQSAYVTLALSLIIVERRVLTLRRVIMFETGERQPCIGTRVIISRD